MWYNYPRREDFEVSFKIKTNFKGTGFDNKLELKYKQASLYDTMEFLGVLDKGSIAEWLLEFIEKRGDANKITLGLIKIDKGLTTKIFNIIKDTRFRGVFGATEKKGNSDGAERPYSSVLAFLCEKVHVSPDEFQKNYTIEQMNFLLDGVVYNINSQTEEGQEENNRTQFNKNNSDEELLELIN